MMERYRKDDDIETLASWQDSESLKGQEKLSENDCSKCGSDDTELLGVGDIEYNGFFPSGEERLKQRARRKCLSCNYIWEYELEGLINNREDSKEDKEPRECHDPNYATELFRKINYPQDYD